MSMSMSRLLRCVVHFLLLILVSIATEDGNRSVYAFSPSFAATADNKNSRRLRCATKDNNDSDDSDDQLVDILELLSTCIDATQRGCRKIRRVHASLSSQEGEDDRNFVSYKVAKDPRSALTAADLAAQAAIVNALERTWGKGLRIVGEEDLSGSEPLQRQEELDNTPLRKNLCRELQPQSIPATATAARKAELNDVTVFVDPLDGTREFVEGRIHNVQTLVGVAVRGRAVAGAVGLPFCRTTSEEEEDLDRTPTVVVYAMVGAGPPQTWEEVEGAKTERRHRRASPDDPVHGGGVPGDGGARPLLVTGDVSDDAALTAAYAAALRPSGRSLLLGGTGQKCLAVAEGRADLAIMNFVSNSWDTCAPEALVRAAGGNVTDLWGEDIVYADSPVPPLAGFGNVCGVVASAAGHQERHEAVCVAMRNSANPAFRQLLRPWGPPGNGSAKKTQQQLVEEALQRRRNWLLKGVSRLKKERQKL